MPVFRGAVIPHNFHFSYSLNTFNWFYFNKYADYHSHKSLY
ncbi:hypothetical protein IEO21_10234 [Rhodonia placenta]|uniref:Uncharacterized protein n=1 Tax=Rhodonia placenta TaxID=104341 RepID=A0A8H7NT01_9APHY|nr:hypothetical protein IEO21_10234 [Postia placenta]